MTCISLPPLEETELLTYLDDEADPHVVDHVERCSHCHERAENLARLQNRLTAQLFRVTCPLPEELGEYHFELLPNERSAGVAQHLEHCPHCRQELAQLESFLADVPAPMPELGRLARVRERVEVLIARLLEGGMGAGPDLAPVPAGIRGDEAGPLIYQAGDVEVTLEIQEDAEQPDRKTILGLITGLEDFGDLEIHVWQADEPLTTTDVDELGNFILPNLAPDTYDLIVSGPEIEIHIQNLEVD